MENKQYIIYAKRKVNQIKDIATKERMQIDVVNISNPTECYGRR